MFYTHQLKKITFEQLQERIDFFSNKYNISNIKKSANQIIFSWNYTTYGYRQYIEFEKFDDNQIIVDIDDSNVALPIVIAITVLFVTYGKELSIFALFIYSILIIAFMYTLDKFVTTQRMDKFLKELETKRIVIKQDGLARCPICHRVVSPTDEYCPNCGFYLGPAPYKFFKSQLVKYEYKSKN